MKTSHKKINEMCGVLLGTGIFFTWLFLLINVEFIFFSEKELIHGAEVTRVNIPVQYLPIPRWFSFGPLPFFLVAGHYLLYSNNIGGIEKIRDVMAMKSILMGFFIWLLVTVIISLLNIDISFKIILSGGFITMIVVYLLKYK